MKPILLPMPFLGLLAVVSKTRADVKVTSPEESIS